MIYDMATVTLISNHMGVDTYLELRKAVGFKPLSRTQAKKPWTAVSMLSVPTLMRRSWAWEDL